MLKVTQLVTGCAGGGGWEVLSALAHTTARFEPGCLDGCALGAAASKGTKSSMSKRKYSDNSKKG